MKITRNWLNDWIDLKDIPTSDLCIALDSMGLELESVNDIKIPQKIVIGYVKECEKHPDADKLSIAQVDIGHETVQIVCGAKNIKAGLYVPVATIGADLGNDFIIKESELRGIKSNGMICSSSELGLGEVNDGILELDDSIGELIIGKSLNEYEILNDTLIEIELTANRGDCLSVYGIARDLGAYFKRELKDIVLEENHNSGAGIRRVLQVDAKEDTESNLLYKILSNADHITPNLNIKLKNALIGEEVKNDITDIIKFASHSSGVLFKTYGVNELNKTDIEEIIKFDIKKDENSLDNIYCEGEKVSTVGIKKNDKCCDLNDFKDIIIEASYINPNTISKNIHAYIKKHSNEAKEIKNDDFFYRSSRGTEENIQHGMQYLQAIMQNINDIQWYGGEEYIHRQTDHQNITINLNKIEALIGQSIDKSTIMDILKSLQFKIEYSPEVQDEFNLTIPLFRNDIKNIGDVTEEIVRIVGIDNINSVPMNFTESKKDNEALLRYQKNRFYRHKAAFSGFFENISFVFSSKELEKKYGLKTLNDQDDLLNPISNELNTLRSTILLNLIQAASKNKKMGFKSIKLYEIGKVFDQNRSESTKMGFILSGKDENESLENSGKPENAGFFKFAKYISQVIGDFEITPSTSKLSNPYECGDIIQNNCVIGNISRVHIDIQQDFDLDTTYICEIDFCKLNFNRSIANTYSKFQAVSRELSLIIPKDLEYYKIKKSINTQNIKTLTNFYPIDVYESDDLGDKKSLSLKFELQSNDKTLEVEEIDTVMNTILQTLQNEHNISLR